jgi:flagellar biosynthesis protein FlhF
MKIKSYFASSAAAAVEQARRELGPEAVILQTRKTGPENRHLGEFEVVVALVPEAGDQASPSEVPESPERLSSELHALRQQLELMRREISRSVTTVPRWSMSSGEAAELFSTLVAEDVDGELAREIADALYARAAGNGGAAGLAVSAAAELERRFRVNPTLGGCAGGPRAVALVGPPGAGKTTTVVKLAMAQGLTARKPVQLLSMDNYRVGGAEQLRSYAAILGVGFQALETVGALAQALEEHRAKDLILIDTPGLGARDMEGEADLVRFFRAHPDIDVHLVLTASMKSADLNRVTERFEVFRPANLLFTRLDETATWGTLFTTAVRTGKPLSFLGTGQQIPEDLEPARKEEILARLVARLTRASLAA